MQFDRHEKSRICLPATVIVVILFQIGAGGGSRAQEGASETKRRLAAMQAAVDDCQVILKEGTKERSLQFGKRPLLRYDDPTRGLLDAGVWRLGDVGRPAAIVTLEIYQLREGTGKLTYEFVSAASSELKLDSPGGVTWKPARTDLNMSVLPEAPRPADSPRERLRQLRELARRFSAHEVSSGNRVECRLLSQPLDRYADPEQKVVDGALFVFANGTNPELALFLECNDSEWFYGVLRMTSARIYAELDGKQFFEAPWFSKYSATAPYTAAGRPFAISD